MITVSQIRNGSGYMRNHLSANDYYSEDEQIVGQWHGKAAWMLGFEGEDVTEEAFEALRSNRHPETGAKLTPRRPKVAFHDFVISAPKSASIAAMVGGDQRIVEAFDRCVLRAFERLENFAAVRVRAGRAYNTEEIRRTGNAVAAVFRHDTSRLLDPQLQTYLVFANATWDEQSKQWIRAKFYREFSQECSSLGYVTEGDGEAFRLSGIDRSIEHAFSQRTLQRERFEARYRTLLGREPGKKRVGQFIKDHKAGATRRFKREYQVAFGWPPTAETVADFIQDWRASKMKRSTREGVQALQQERMTAPQAHALRNTVAQALKSLQDATQAEDHGDALNHDEVESHSPELAANAKQSATQRWSGRETPATGKQRRAVGSCAKIRRLRRTINIVSALQGHPAKVMARRVQQLARRSHGTRRRVC